MTNQPTTLYLKDYRPPDFLIDQVALCFELGAAATIVTATLTMRRNPAAIGSTQALRLDGEALTLQAVSLDGRKLSPQEYRQQPQALIVHQVPEQFELQTIVIIHPEANTALEGLYVSGEMLCTQCEAEGFRRITYFLDRPDVMACYQVTLVADPAQYPVLLANGNLLERRVRDDGQIEVLWEDPFPKPSYLFALVAGDLAVVEDQYRTGSGRTVALKLYVEPQHVNHCEHAMHSLKQAMRWDETCYGREYDLDLFMIVAVSHFNMGAMENKGLNLFNAKYILASPETATDQDFAAIESIVAHEYFHNWTGNRITCRDWFQLSLKEGLTVYRDQEFSADMGSRSLKRIEDVRLLRAHQFPEDNSPLAHPVRPESYIEINNFYTATVYEKGAELIRMLALLLGSERFRAATDLYFARHDGQAVTTEDFVRCMEDASGLNFTQFRRWYSQAGTPVVEVSATWEAATKSYRLNFHQHTPPTPGQAEKQPLHIPIVVGFLHPDGQPLPLRLEGATAAQDSHLLELRTAEQAFCFVDVPTPPLLALLRGFSAPVKLVYPYTDAQLSTLMQHERDGFCRWDAGRTLYERAVLALVADPTAQVSESLINAVAGVLNDSATDPALVAEMLTVSSELELAECMAVVDVEGLHRAREQVLTTLSQTFSTQWRALYQRASADEVYVWTPQAAGQRALNNRILAYLLQTPDQDKVALAQQQFAQANNMTDRLAALRLLVELAETPWQSQTEQALAEFYQRWAHQPLVIDKWFALQAQSSTYGTLERVKQLRQHPAFVMTNPNRVRSLIGAFASGNPLHFHRADGASYLWLTDQVIDLNATNPQLAARLLQPLTRWQRYSPTRQKLMQAQLQRLQATPGLSNDLFEMISKSLT